MEKIIKKNILISTLLFPPDQVSTAYLYGDITNHFLKLGWNVDVFTTMPHYNIDIDYNDKFRKLFFYCTSNFNNAYVYHIAQKKTKSILVRSAYLIWFHFVYLIKGLFGKKYDIILTPSPLLTLGFLSAFISKFRGTDAIYNVQEIYPDLLIKHGKLKSRLLINILSKIEYLTYKWSAKVTVIDEHFAKFIENRLEKNKIEIIPNFVDLNLYKKNYTEETILKKFGDKYIVGYVGNLGELQDWDIFFNTAKILNNYEKIQFVLIGGGSEYNKLKNLSKETQNVEVFEYQKRELVPSILSRINLHLICMNNSSDFTGLPSKVYTILAIGRPILASTSPNSALSNLILKSKNGKTTPLNDANCMSDCILNFYSNLYDDLSESYATNFIKDNYSKDVVLKKYQNLFLQLLD